MLSVGFVDALRRNALTIRVSFCAEAGWIGTPRIGPSKARRKLLKVNDICR